MQKLIFKTIITAILFIALSKNTQANAGCIIEGNFLKCYDTNGKFLYSTSLTANSVTYDETTNTYTKTYSNGSQSVNYNSETNQLTIIGNYSYDNQPLQTNTEVYTYDANGNRINLIRETKLNGEIHEVQENKWWYDTNGNYIKQTHESKDGNNKLLLYGQEDCTYNEKNYNTSCDYHNYYGDGTLYQETNFHTTYDDDENELSYKSIDRQYYENGKLEYDRYEERDAVSGTKTYDKHYDETGKLVNEYVWYENPDGTYGETSTYYDEYDDNDNPVIYVEKCTNNGCNYSYYDTKGNILSINDNEVTQHCSVANVDGACIKCNGANFRLNDGECDRLRYTPAEAAEVLHNDNTNSVTITFRK